MEAKPLSIGKILGERQRFVVPIYQRTYSWGRREIEPLFDQIEAKAEELLATGKVAFSHYMGALLLIPESDPIFGRVQAFNVVDGQQRLTTFHLCFAALRDLAREYGFDDIAQQLADLIVHSDQTPMQDRANERYKLQPTTYDRALFRDLIDLDWRAIRKKHPDAFYKKGTIRPDAPEALGAYWYFWEEAAAFIKESRELPHRRPAGGYRSHRWKPPTHCLRRLRQNRGCRAQSSDHPHPEAERRGWLPTRKYRGLHIH